MRDQNTRAGPCRSNHASARSRSAVRSRRTRWKRYTADRPPSRPTAYRTQAPAVDPAVAAASPSSNDIRPWCTATPAIGSTASEGIGGNTPSASIIAPSIAAPAIRDHPHGLVDDDRERRHREASEFSRAVPAASGSATRFENAIATASTTAAATATA